VDDVRNGSLGSPPLFELLKTLKPDWWFSAHLHVKFEATYLHAGGAPADLPSNPVEKNPDEIAVGDDDDEPTPSMVAPADPKPSAPNLNPDEITLDDEEEDVAPAPVAPPPREKTNFLALDKCIPNSRRQFLEVNAGLREA
jgi:lariat debranching enzyme